MGFILSLLFGFVPMLLFAGIINWFDRFEKEPLALLGGVFVWGAVFAAGVAFFVNSVLGSAIYWVTGSEHAAEFTSGSLIAPVVEEMLKGAAVLLVFLIFHAEFDSILDGIVYAAVTALGFAATENVFYIYTMGFQPDGYSGLFSMVFIRVILVGWQHPFYTAFFGIGLAAARLSKNWLVRIGAPVAGYSAAVFFHAVHNTIADLASGIGGLVLGTALDWLGWLIMLAFIIWMIFREKKELVSQLREEIDLGNLSPQLYSDVCSGWRRFSALFASLGSTKHKQIHRFYQLCGELSHKKSQYQSMGDEQGNLHEIEYLRGELRRFSSAV